MSVTVERALNSSRICYKDKPDYENPLLVIPSKARERMLARLHLLYGATEAEAHMPELERILRVHYAHKPQDMIEAEKAFEATNRFTEADLILITYGDLLQGNAHSPLAALANFLNTIPGLSQIINTLHILPFFPYSSDRGFSITDFSSVNPQLGSWQDIKTLGQQYQLMFDGVFNHVSAESLAFQERLNGNPNYQEVFTTYRSPDELTPEQRQIIVRPRTSDILTKYQAIDGPIWVWTTFSPDQIDLNFRHPNVLISVIETLLLYVRRGANIIRLDAVTYLWEEPGTPCAHLKQTHEVIKLLRDVLSVAAPDVALLTESNAPHADNVSYFGDGSDEAQMVYNFALPPLVLYTFYKEDATILTKWAKDLEYPSKTTTFFNVLDTHDGVGLMGVKNILSETDINFIIQKARENGALISYRTGEDGQKTPYEINTTWFSALNSYSSQEDIVFQVKRFVASRSIALVLRGAPGIYLHGLIGSLNDVEAVLKSKSTRDINRQVIDEQDLLAALKNPKSKLSYIARRLGRLLNVRVGQSAFHPNGEQRIFMISPQVFTVLRISPAGDQHILTLTNVTPRPCQVKIPLSELGVQETQWYGLFGRRGWMTQDQILNINLQPYDVVWLIPFGELEGGIAAD